LTVAVRDQTLPSEQFRKPTLKAGVPHVEAPCTLLERMLTLRIHLDDVTDENGPLRVVPGSHRSGKETVASPAEPAVIHARSGDVLAMRPLVSHSSGASTPGTHRHRRVLHLEFAGCEELPDGFRWHDFIR
jgi:ectoine hydroxylase-related dioxygenase (phytanoyl-CoA dioxygenase family)